VTSPSDPLICLVTDRRAATPGARTLREELAGLERQLDEAMTAGVDLIQLRERDLDAANLGALAARLVGRAPAPVRIVINDRADVALAAGAAGVHLRADGPGVAVVRPLGPAGWLVGRSVHSPEEAAASGTADYLVFGTVFASPTKGQDAPVAGAEALRAAVAASAAPVLAIGGIAPERMAACRQAGSAGVAAIGVFLPRGSAAHALGAGEAVLALRLAWRDARRSIPL
jgi:thiamine-phosphate pyrophosphorylase